jgi:site-specific DNA recombinase
VSAPLPTFSQTRFHIGEVVHRRAVHLGEREPILDRTLFDAVQAKLAGTDVASNKLRDRLSGQNS